MHTSQEFFNFSTKRHRMNLKWRRTEGSIVRQDDWSLFDDSGDRIEIGIYRLQYVIEPLVPERDRPPEWACVQALSGDAVGNVIAIDRPIVSLSNASGQVAVIARRTNGFFITHLEGTTFPLVNGEPTGLVPRLLRPDDLIELAGTIFRFSFEPPS
jgi:hypothetical protein